MEDDLAMNPQAKSAMVAVGVLSLTALFWLFQRHLDGQPLLVYQPRRRVPWGPLATLVALYFVASSFVPLLMGDQSLDSTKIKPEDFIYNGWVGSVVMLGFVAAAMAWLAAIRGADARDLGLPANRQQLVQDVGIGTVACLASLLPIYLVLYGLYIALQPEQQHPLIEQLLEYHTPGMILVGFVTAVVVAPLSEEFSFRLLLQGWLERYEDERIGYRGSLRETEEGGFVVAVGEDASARLEVRESGDLEDSEQDGEPHAEPMPPPEHGLLPGLPHGWAPILVSGFAFGLAHFGHGVSPVPLFLFGSMLGYLYQRTHRLAPCIVAHMLFNTYSLVLLWLQIK